MHRKNAHKGSNINIIALKGEDINTFALMGGICPDMDTEVVEEGTAICAALVSFLT